MRKRVLSFLLSVCLTLTFVPLEVLAADAPEEVGREPALSEEWSGEKNPFPSEEPLEDAYYGGGDGYLGDPELEALLGGELGDADFAGEFAGSDGITFDSSSLGEPVGGPVEEAFYEPVTETGEGGELDGEDADSDSDWEFVPGVAPSEDELIYPDYEEWVGLQAGLDPEWYTVGIQSPVESQGPNGVCWTFGTLATMTAHMNAVDYERTGINPNYNLSELHMTHCLSNRFGNTKEGKDRAPDDGGTRENAASYLMRDTSLSGAVWESEDPFANYTQIGHIIQPRDPNVSRTRQKIFQARNILFLTGRRTELTYEAIDLIKQAVKYRGGVGVSLFWQDQTTATNGMRDQRFYNKNTGAYYYYIGADNSVEPATNPDHVNHLVEIVGWNDNYSRYNFSSLVQPAIDGAWLIKNSWGTNEGIPSLPGYYWVSYADTNFPNDAFCFSGVDNYDPRQIVYETDYVNNCEAWGFSDVQEYYFAKIFQKKIDEPEVLNSVRIFVASPFLSIEVGCVPGESMSEGYGHRFTSLGGIGPDMGMPVGCPGWYTVPLSNYPRIDCRAGGEFAVIVRIRAPYGNIMIGTDSKPENAAGAAPVYCSHDDQYWWYDDDRPNYCIKAVTYPESARGQNQVLVDKAERDLLWCLIDSSGEYGRLNLPSRYKFADVTWSCENDAIDPKTGRWQGARFDKPGTVELTATLSYEDSGENSRATAEKLFRVNVGNRPITQADQVAAAQDDWTWEDWWAYIGGENVRWDQIRTDLTIPSSIAVSLDSGHNYTLYPLSTAHAGSKANVDTPWTYVSTTGKVTRPAYGQPDSKGSFWLKIPTDSSGNYQFLKSWELTVLAYKGEITSVDIPNVTASTEFGTVLEAECSTKGNPGTIQYQWYRCYDPQMITSQQLPGETGPLLKVQSASQTAHTQYYCCKISAPDAREVTTNVVAVNLVPGYAEAELATGHTVELYNVDIPEGAAFYAACYDASGRLKQVLRTEWTYPGVGTGTQFVSFANATVAEGWKLFGVDSSGKPLCGALVIGKHRKDVNSGPIHT